MKILAKTKKHFDGREEYHNKLAKPSQVERLGKFLKKNLTGVYKVETPSNQYVIYTTLLYQVPLELRKKMRMYFKEFKGAEEDIYEANVYFNITTYKQKIRVNIILLNKDEPTLGFLIFTNEDLMSLPACKDRLLDYTYEKITAYFANYEVLI
jgi:hypothetical protein